jgi:GNAT superfamily N-acetyltransferase
LIITVAASSVFAKVGKRMQIRRASPRDFEPLRAIELASFETLRAAGAVSGVPSASGDAELHRYLHDKLLYVACDHEGAAVGYSGGYVADNFLYIAEVDVLPAWQRKGLGRSLITTLIEDGRRRRLLGATLTTDRFAPFNAPFYERLGFGILEGDAVPPHLRIILDRQIENGLDPLRRVAMALLF